MRGEWRSQTTLFGLPLVHLKWRGTPDRLAGGIIAIGPVAYGVIAIGWFGALGPIALSPLLSVGLIAAMGLVRLGWFGGSHGLGAITIWMIVGLLLLGGSTELWSRLRRFFRKGAIRGRVVARETLREPASSAECVQYQHGAARSVVEQPPVLFHLTPLVEYTSAFERSGCDFIVAPHDGGDPVYVETRELELVLRPRDGHGCVAWIAPGDTVSVVGDFDVRADPAAQPTGYRRAPQRRVLLRGAVTDYDVAAVRAQLAAWFLLALAYLAGAVGAALMLMRG